MTLKQLVKLFSEEVLEQIQKKITGHINISVNLSQGGIGNCNVNIDKTIK